MRRQGASERARREKAACLCACMNKGNVGRERGRGLRASERGTKGQIEKEGDSDGEGVACVRACLVACVFICGLR